MSAIVLKTVKHVFFGPCQGEWSVEGMVEKLWGCANMLLLCSNTICCLSVAAVVGLLYPCIDSHLGEPHKFKREWASVMRCIAVFVGINHASAKLDFANNVQLSLTLAALSLGLWWTFDRSRSGFGLGITIAVLATLITQFLVYNGVYQYTSPDFLYIRSWLPCIFFSGGVTVGNIGRQLAMGAPEKPHMD
ncbi:insulin-induced gene 1 protein-like [Polyodon spathula]|uniref:insulin-induced gene 1 protein-like n=1 Tax=Polyodon spathula TaxID=7913 RepID=UPI001B7E78DC|nr:insulin-induced gene 1 protein-like [Polyodon spathula]